MKKRPGLAHFFKKSCFTETDPGIVSTAPTRIVQNERKITEVFKLKN